MYPLEQTYLHHRLQRARHELRASRALLWVAGALVGLNLTLIVLAVARGWRPRDCLSALALAVWAALLALQSRICVRRRRRVEELERQLQQAPGGRGQQPRDSCRLPAALDR